MIIYVCMYVCKPYGYTYTNIYIYIYTHIMHVRIYIYMYNYIRICIYIYIHIHICIHDIYKTKLGLNMERDTPRAFVHVHNGYRDQFSRSSLQINSCRNHQDKDENEAAESLEKVSLSYIKVCFIRILFCLK